MKYREFEASAHMPLPTEDMFRIAADPGRLRSWIPSELAPGGKHGAKTPAGGPEAPGGMRISERDHRLEWSTAQDGADTWLEVRPDGQESEVILHLSLPTTNGADQAPQRQLEKALQHLEAEANKGLAV